MRTAYLKPVLMNQTFTKSDFSFQRPFTCVPGILISVGESEVVHLARFQPFRCFSTSGGLRRNDLERGE